MHIEKIREHYEHAKQKHPYFCDSLLPKYISKPDRCKQIKGCLEASRLEIEERTAENILTPRDLLNCEVWEINEAVNNGDTAAAVEECYDAIAVLLRMVDVLEGRQALGNPNEKREESK
jgi:hypothetical protein